MNSTEEECSPNTTVLNLTDDESLYSTIYLPVEWYIYLIVYPCFLIFGTTTNLSFLFVVIRVPYMHSITNFYLCNLAIADLLYLVATVVCQMVKYIRSPIRFANDSIVLCMLEQYVLIASFVASIHLVGLVTLERYLAVCHPLKHYLVKGWKRTLKLTSLSWTFAAVAGFYNFLYVQGLENICVIWPDDSDYANNPNTYKICIINFDNEDILSIIYILYLMLWLIEFLANVTMYFQILRHLHHRATPNGIANDQHAVSTRNQVALMLVVNGVVFFLCCSMAFVSIFFGFMDNLDKDTPKGRESFMFQQVSIFIFLLNSSINPMIYNVTNTKYRKAFYLAFTRRNI